jgi:hypothetical protein
MAFDLTQWTFLTKVLGMTINISKAPSSVKDAKGVTDTAATFDASKASKEQVAQAAVQVKAWADSIRSKGRDQATSGMNANDWDAHVAMVRGTVDDTRAMRKNIKDQLAKPDLGAEMRTELEALQLQVEDALVEALDLEPAHGPTNHVKLSRDGAGKRALLGVNPRTGKANDKAANATKFKSPGAFLTAMDFGLDSKAYKDAIAGAFDMSDPKNPKQTKDYITFSLTLEDVFGKNFLDEVDGQTVVGSKKDRAALKKAVKGKDDTEADKLLNGGMGVAKTDLKEGTINFGFFFKDGKWELSTIHPEIAMAGPDNPKNPRPAVPDLRYNRVGDHWEKRDPSRKNEWHTYDPDAESWI